MTVYQLAKGRFVPAANPMDKFVVARLQTAWLPVRRDPFLGRFQG